MTARPGAAGLLWLWAAVADLGPGSGRDRPPGQQPAGTPGGGSAADRLAGP
jgi:hypothetical protein